MVSLKYPLDRELRTDGLSGLALLASQHVCMGDRESDMLELMLCGRNLGYRVDYLIRSRHNRTLPEGPKLSDKVQAAPLLGQHTF